MKQRRSITRSVMATLSNSGSRTLAWRAWNKTPA
jgi:hypothetical protein